MDEDDDYGEDCPARCEDSVPLGGHYYCPVCGREWFDDEDEANEQLIKEAD